MKKPLVILGTNRDDSNTLKALPFKDFELVELHKSKLQHYVYGVVKPLDDFLFLAQKMVEADEIIFATPVYWYAMSGVMKIFIDRFSDLISTSKPLGKALKGKKVSLFVTGSDDLLPEGFDVPFRLTSKYFEMEFQSTTYLSIKD